MYYNLTGNLTLIETMWKNLVNAYNWIISYGDIDGDLYIEYDPQLHFGLFHQGWKDDMEDHLGITPPVKLVEVQGYVYAALQSIMHLAKLIGDRDIWLDAGSRADELYRKINRDFYFGGFYAIALDGYGEKVKYITTNPGHLLAFKVIPEERVNRFIKRLFMKDLWSAYGLRCHSTNENTYNPSRPHLGCIWPHDNWFIYKGLLRYGYTYEAKRISKALLKAYGELGCIPEYYQVNEQGEIIPLDKMSIHNGPNRIQAWSIGALIDMLIFNP
jgi:glycogen debranching enzyme